MNVNRKQEKPVEKVNTEAQFHVKEKDPEKVKSEKRLAQV